MTNLNLRVLVGAIGRRPRLRVDRIRRDTLTQLAAALAEDHDNRVLDALDALVDAVKHDAADNEIDGLVADIETTAHMDDAAMDLTPGDVRQLADEARIAAVQSLLGSIPTQQGRRAS
jgi:hypothetical protein